MSGAPGRRAARGAARGSGRTWRPPRGPDGTGGAGRHPVGAWHWAGPAAGPCVHSCGPSAARAGPSLRGRPAARLATSYPSPEGFLRCRCTPHVPAPSAAGRRTSGPAARARCAGPRAPVGARPGHPVHQRPVGVPAGAHPAAPARGEPDGGEAGRPVPRGRAVQPVRCRPACALRRADAQRPHRAVRVLLDGRGGSRAFQVPYDQLGLPVDVVRAAGPRLRASPLYELVRDHLVRLAGLADVMAADPGAAALGTATTELVRALLVSAADGPAPGASASRRWRRGCWPTPGQHLTDPGLTPERIAGRTTSRCASSTRPAPPASGLEQWLIEQRLEAARAELAARRGGGAPSRPRPAPADSPTRATSAGGSAPPTG